MDRLRPAVKPKDVAQHPKLPDITDMITLFEWAQVSIGSREQLFTLYISMQRHLAQNPNIVSGRLFGMIQGRDRPYFIFETFQPCVRQSQSSETNTVVQVESPQLPKEPESWNLYAYWVSQELDGQWTRLPDISSKHLQEARNLGYEFSGNLAAEVNFLGGDEAYLLRARIALIASATTLSPQGYYTRDGESSILNQRFIWHRPEDLYQLACWTRHYPGSELKPISEEESKWEIRKATDLLPPAYCPIIVKSKEWLGAQTITRHQVFLNIYVGDGRPSYQE